MQKLTLRVEQSPGIIELNYDEIEKALIEKLKEYEGAVFTGDTMDIAKKERASLRKGREELDGIRKDVKNEWMKPYNDFEARVKSLLAKFDKPISLIDTQVKSYEDGNRAKKRERAREIYAGLIDGMGEYLPFDRIYDDRWGNASTSLKLVRAEIDRKINDAKTAVESICALDSEKTQDALKAYKETLDVTKAIATVMNYERQKAEILKREEERRKREEERQRQAEIGRARAAEREAARREDQIRKETEAAVFSPTPITAIPPEQENPFLQPEEEEDAEDILPFTQPTTVMAFYRVVATQKELEDVEMAFNSMGIYFERRES